MAVTRNLESESRILNFGETMILGWPNLSLRTLSGRKRLKIQDEVTNGEFEPLSSDSNGLNSKIFENWGLNRLHGVSILKMALRPENRPACRKTAVEIALKIPGWLYKWTAVLRARRRNP